MPQLIVRELEEKVVRRLKERARERGVSIGEELRRILREPLLPDRKQAPSFKDFLLSMPDSGEDSDFERARDSARKLQNQGVALQKVK